MSYSKLIPKTILSFALALIVWEVILSIFVIKTPVNFIHPLLGKIYRPGLMVSGQEGYSITHINSLGMREEEITPKAKKEFRILMLGDSYTMGLQVDDKALYSARLQQSLRLPDKNVRVINAGMPGFSPANYLWLESFYKSRFKPDYYVVEMNDTDFMQDMVSDNNFIIVKEDGAGYKLQKNTSFVSQNPLKVLLPQFNDMIQFSSFRIGAERLQALLKMHKSSDATSISKDIDPDANQKLADWTINNLKQKYKNLVIVFIPTIKMENTSDQPSIYEAALAESANKNHVDIINMRNRFTQYYLSTHQPVVGFSNTQPGKGHINEIGHRLVSESLTAYFKEKELK